MTEAQATATSRPPCSRRRRRRPRAWRRGRAGRPAGRGCRRRSGPCGPTRSRAGSRGSRRPNASRTTGPAARSRRATAAPMPRPPPATTATRPVIRNPRGLGADEATVLVDVPREHLGDDPCARAAARCTRPSSALAPRGFAEDPGRADRRHAARAQRGSSSGRGSRAPATARSGVTEPGARARASEVSARRRGRPSRARRTRSPGDVVPLPPQPPGGARDGLGVAAVARDEDDRAAPPTDRPDELDEDETSASVPIREPSRRTPRARRSPRTPAWGRRARVAPACGPRGRARPARRRPGRRPSRWPGRGARRAARRPRAARARSRRRGARRWRRSRGPPGSARGECASRAGPSGLSSHGEAGGRRAMVTGTGALRTGPRGCGPGSARAHPVGRPRRGRPRRCP